MQNLLKVAIFCILLSTLAFGQGGTTSSDLYPAVSGQNLGNPSQTWNLYGQDVTVYGTLTATDTTFTNHDKVCEANNYLTPSSDLGDKINAAFTDCGAMGIVNIQPGTYNFATQIVPTNGAVLQCSGGSWKANGAGPLYHAACTLNWTGTTTPSVSISGSAATGTIIRGIRFDNSGSATMAILIDNTQGVELDDVSVDLTTVPYSTAGIQIGDTTAGHNVVDWTLRRVTVSGNPIGLYVAQTSAHGECYGCHIQHNTTQNVLLGSTTSNAISVSFFGGTFEQDANLDSVYIQRVKNVNFYGSYWENLGTGCAINIPSTATLAQGVHVYGGYGSSFTTPASQMFCTNFAAAVLSIDGVTMVGYTSPNYIVQNTSSATVSVTNSYATDTGAATADSYTNVYYCNNRLFGTNSGCVFSNGTSVSLNTGIMTWLKTPVRSGTNDSIIEFVSSGSTTPDWYIGTVVSSGVAGRYSLTDHLNNIEVFNCKLNAAGCTFAAPLSVGQNQITSTLTTGTAPFVIASTTKVSNLNVDQVDGGDWASPLALGSSTPAAVTATTYSTATNCSSAAAPAVCGSASAGTVVVAAAGSTVVVNTTAVTANSEVFLTRDDSLGTKLSVTCNTATAAGDIKVSARSAGTSFTITVQNAPAVNPLCLSYRIVN